MRDNRIVESGKRLDNSPWGYQVNINHPEVRPFYERYKRWQGIPPNSPLSDAERFEFEKYYTNAVEKKERKKREAAEKPAEPDSRDAQ